LDPDGSGDKYRLQLLPSEPEEFSHICLKVIGAGPTICLRAHCKTNHQGKRSTTISREDLVVLKTQLSSFDQLSMRSDMVSSELRSRWLGAKETLSQWLQIFRIARIEYSSDAKTSIDSPVTSTEYEVKSEFARKAENYHTPLKRKVSKFPSSHALAYTPYKKQLKTTNDFEEPEAISRAIMGLDEGLETAGNTLAELMSTYETSVQDLDMGLRALEYKANSIRDTLGSPNLGIS
jgi:hypothetical protein